MEHDALYTIGKGHRKCDDYAASGSVPGGGYAIVSDGCSGARDTDTGARLLAHAAKRIVRSAGSNLLIPGQEALSHQRFGDLVLGYAGAAAEMLGLDRRCLTATLLIAHLLEERVSILMYGDGAVAVRFKDGSALLWSVDFKLSVEGNQRSAPFYLSYRTDAAARADYDRHQREDTLISTTTRVTADGELGASEQQVLRYDHPLCWSAPADTVQAVVLLSDGIGTFGRKGEPPRPASTLIGEILGFKNHKGDFIQRRMQSMKQRLEADEQFHADDLAAAGFFLHQEGAAQ